MKKWTKIIGLALLISSFTGCNRVGVKDGTDAAKVLLANERLDEKSLRTEGNLFSNGKKAFNRVINETRKHAKKVEKQGVKGKMEVNGDTYKWSEAGDYSNFLSFFESYTINIEFNAQKGSELIELTKNKIKIVNKWVKIQGEEVLLLVDENSETILYRSNNQYEICRRYQNDEGLNVYEMFIENSETKTRNKMTYIPGLRYEYSHILDGSYLFIVADKDKGYWDIMTTNGDAMSNDYETFTNLVMKDEAIYETSYSVYGDRPMYGSFDLVSADGKSDLFTLSGDTLCLFTTGVNGLSHFELTTTKDRIYDLSKNNHEYPSNYEDYDLYSVGEGNDIHYFNNTNGKSPTAVFSNGKKINQGDKFYNDEINVRSLMIYPIGDQDFYGHIELTFNNDDIDHMFKYLKQLFDEYDVSFKGDFDEIRESAKYAKKDVVNFGDYYKWNGYRVNNLDDIRKAMNEEVKKIEEFTSIYDKYKDVEVVGRFSQKDLDNSYVFGDLEIVSNGSITNEGMKVTVDNFKVKVNNTSLFVSDTEYKVEFATALTIDNEYYNLFPLTLDSSVTKKYNSEKIFEIAQTASFTLPILEEGNYTLVAYIATNDEGIRVSNPIALNSSSINEYKTNSDDLMNRIYSENNKIKLESKKNNEIHINLEGDYTYDSLYNEMQSKAYKYGMTSEATIEFNNNGNWVEVSNTDEIKKGTYRLKYLSNNIEAYVIAEVR